MNESALKRFLPKFSPNPATGCWDWTGCIPTSGYGRFNLDGRNRGCVNPAHLEPVTRQENSRRGFLPHAAKTHCRNGHPYNEENTRITSKGWRVCRMCTAANDARWYRRSKVRRAT